MIEKYYSRKRCDVFVAGLDCGILCHCQKKVKCSLDRQLFQRIVEKIGSVFLVHGFLVIYRIRHQPVLGPG